MCILFHTCASIWYNTEHYVKFSLFNIKARPHACAHYKSIPLQVTVTSNKCAQLADDLKWNVFLWSIIVHAFILHRAIDLSSQWYCKTLNVTVPFILRISWAKQNREIKGCEYQLQAKIGRKYYSISNYMVLICQNKRGQNNFAC